DGQDFFITFIERDDDQRLAAAAHNGQKVVAVLTPQPLERRARLVVDIDGLHNRYSSPSMTYFLSSLAAPATNETTRMAASTLYSTRNSRTRSSQAAVGFSRSSLRFRVATVG